MMERVKSADSLPWTTKLPVIFQKEWGYSIIENIPLLFEDIGDFQKVRYHYWRNLSYLLTQSYSKVMKEWCKKHNLKFVGHLMGEDSFISQLQYSVNVMPHYEYMDIPGIDHLTMDLYWPTGDPFILTPKQAASVANQLGIKEVLSEMYGTSDQGNSFEDRKRVYQWLGVLGINYRCYHGPFYSMRGLRKRYYPVNLNYQQPWWSENRIIADFAARLSYILRQGQYKADILVIHSIESYYLEGRISRKLSKKVGSLDRDLITLSHNLLKIQRSYDYGDETLLAKYGKIVKDNIAVGEMIYKIVILPSVKTLRESTVKLLNEFLDAGGTVISVGTLPTLIDAEVDKNIDVFNKRIMQILNDAEVLKLKLDSLVSPDIQVSSYNNMPAETIWIQQRLLDNGQIFFLTNIDSEKTIVTEVKIKGTGKLEYWNLENGEVECVPQQKKGEYIITKLQFVPDGSYLLFLNESVSPKNISEKVSEIIKRVSLEDFRIIRDDPNSMTLDFCRYKKGNEGWSDILPIMGVQDILVNEKYKGSVTLQFEFVSEIKPNRCAVVIEEAEEYFVTINGNKVKYNGLPYYRDKCFLPIDVTRHVQTGINYIEISRHFQAPERETIDNENLYKFYGTELEQIYLIGDFAVKGEYISQDFFEYTRHRYKPSFVITEESGISQGDLFADGYCFFNGTINLETSVNITNIKKNERYYIDIEKLDAVIAKIRINNRDAGKLAWRPYRLEITDYIWEGENKIEISLTNSLRNLLGGLHFVPLKDVSGGQWVQKAKPSSGDGTEWYKDRENNRFWSDDYFFRPFGIDGNVSVICERF